MPGFPSEEIKLLVVSIPTSSFVGNHLICRPGMPIVGHLTVPEEVFQQILCYTPRESLPLLSLVSKSWYMSVTPTLYRNIELVWRRTQYFCRETLGRRLWCKRHGGPCSCEEQAPCKPEYHPEETFGKRCWCSCLTTVSCQNRTYPSLYLLVRTLISSPEHAGLVRCLRLVGAVPRSVWTEPQQTGLSNQDSNKYDAYCEKVYGLNAQRQSGSESLIKALQVHLPLFCW